jgi:hypothetical protein
MKLKAEVILQDLKWAIAAHSDSLQGEEFRISWFGIIGMLRAVGHVLNNVDSSQSDRLRTIIERRFQEIRASKPKPEIFWHFIEFERNRFLKEYEHGIDRGTKLGPIERDGGNEVYINVDHGRSQGARFSSPSGEFFSVISSGYFKGRSDRDVAKEALNWWTNYIDEIKLEYESVDT